MKKKIVAIALTMTVILAAMQTLRYESVLADRIEEVTGEDADEPDPETQTVEEVIDEDYDTSSVTINDTNFPDAIFRNYVSETLDTVQDGILSADEISAVTQINVSNKSIADLTGIEVFEYLEKLYCWNNSLTSLDVSSNTALEILDCHNNQLTSLNVKYDTALRIVVCYGNQLTNLDLSYNTALTQLDCWNNQLSSLDLSHNTALTWLECWNNQLTSLDFTYNTELTYLKCWNNQLTSLDVSHCTALDIFHCNNNQLTSLDISSNTELTVFSCYGNQLTSLDISNCRYLVDTYNTGTCTESDDYVWYSKYSSDVDHNCHLYIDYGTTIITEAPAPVESVDMYRLYNPNSGEHFYTASLGERNHLISLGWNDEGIGWVAPETSNTPVYRLYNQNGGEHHYTTSIGERDHLISLGWNDEGIGWYSDDARTVPLYRQYNPNAYANNHNYTPSIRENDHLVSLGWQAEGIGWYGVGT